VNKYIFLDFNGTVLNDVDICLELLNDILVQTGKEKISKEKYLEVFGFPVKDYYVRAGVDFNVKSFQELADFFIDEYTRRNVSECTIYSDFNEFINKARKQGYKIVLCSASKKILLIDQLKAFNILDCFDDVIGLENHLAFSKVELAKKYLEDNNINPDDVTFIGDTDHDYEVGIFCKAKSYLVARGHQIKEKLLKLTNNVYDTLLEALDNI